jgi:hypothetical protein
MISSMSASVKEGGDLSKSGIIVKKGVFEE